MDADEKVDAHASEPMTSDTRAALVRAAELVTDTMTAQLGREHRAALILNQAVTNAFEALAAIYVARGWETGPGATSHERAK